MITCRFTLDFLDDPIYNGLIAVLDYDTVTFHYMKSV